MNRLRFTKLREVISPNRANDGDAGLDFYMPTNLMAVDYKGDIAIGYKDGFITSIDIAPHTRVLIPSGIRVLLEPKESMLTAANKSGIASKKGLVYSAQIVDSPYTGELHIGIINTGETIETIEAGKKLMQFIHVPVYLTQPEEISFNEYEELATDWGTRGSNGFGSSDK